MSILFWKCVNLRELLQYDFVSSAFACFMGIGSQGTHKSLKISYIARVRHGRREPQDQQIVLVHIKDTDINSQDTQLSAIFLVNWSN